MRMPDRDATSKATHRRAEPPISIAAFCGPGIGHFGTLAPVVAGLLARGHRVVVYGPNALREPAAALGAGFVDLYRYLPLERADGRSVPYPCRSISHAGLFARELIAMIESACPDLVVYETFAVAGRLVGHALGIPHVNVCPVHRLSGTDDELRAITESRNVVVDPACTEAVGILVQDYGLEDANPFWYLSARSPYLNLYCEPAPFLAPAERTAFEPVRFFGSLPWGVEADGIPEPREASSRPRVCIAFGTVVWDYFADIGLECIHRVATALGRRRGAEVVVGLGGWHRAPAAWRDELARAGVAVDDEIDQWKVLEGTDLMVTHHGLKSTHEAVFHEVPMLSLPFFSDQPSLAERCQALGLAEAVCPEPLTPPRTDEVLAAFDRLEARRDGVRERLAQARCWELATLGNRAAILDDIVAMVRR